MTEAEELSKMCVRATSKVFRKVLGGEPLTDAEERLFSSSCMVMNPTFYGVDFKDIKEMGGIVTKRFGPVRENRNP